MTKKDLPKSRTGLLGSVLLCAVLLCGCASTPPAQRHSSRAFDFQTDTFAYPNELEWEYFYDANGHWTTRSREPKPSYTTHCFVVARSACQFFEQARFEPAQAVADEATYRKLVRQVVACSLRHPLPDTERIVIPGYANLRAFSQAHEALLKAECGSLWQCYFQRGNWRMVFPFRRRQQEQVAKELLAQLRPDHPLVIHLARFPQLTINHAVVVYAAKESEQAIEFSLYDPNDPNHPSHLTFERASRTFMLPPSNYFRGGRVDVYQVYCGWRY